MSEIITSIAGFSGLIKMLIFEKEMTARAWLVFAVLFLVLLSALGWAGAKAFEAVIRSLILAGWW